MVHNVLPLQGLLPASLTQPGGSGKGVGTGCWDFMSYPWVSSVDHRWGESSSEGMIVQW